MTVHFRDKVTTMLDDARAGDASRAPGSAAEGFGSVIRADAEVVAVLCRQFLSGGRLLEDKRVACAWLHCEASENPERMDGQGWGWVDREVYANNYPELHAAGGCGFLCGEHAHEYLRGLVSLQGEPGSPWCERCDYSGWIGVDGKSEKCPECRGLGAILRGAEHILVTKKPLQPKPNVTIADEAIRGLLDQIVNLQSLSMHWIVWGRLNSTEETIVQARVFPVSAPGKEWLSLGQLQLVLKRGMAW